MSYHEHIRYDLVLSPFNQALRSTQRPVAASSVAYRADRFGRQKNDSIWLCYLHKAYMSVPPCCSPETFLTELTTTLGGSSKQQFRTWTWCSPVVFVAGYGVGILADLSPLYQAEILHPSIRRLTTLQQVFSSFADWSQLDWCVVHARNRRFCCSLDCTYLPAAYLTSYKWSVSKTELQLD